MSHRRSGGTDPAPFVVIAGADGVGKSTLADALEARPMAQPAVRLHHRIGLLPRRASSRVATDRPHAARPYPSWLSMLKILYLAADYLAGYAFRVRPAMARGRWVVLERGWGDLEVDPVRYRLAAVGGLTRRLARILPRPTLLVVLEAPADVIRARKAELARPELERQAQAWRRIASAGPSVVLDARRPIPELVDAVLEAVEASQGSAGTLANMSAPARYVALPSSRRPRFVLPAGSRSLAYAGLALYQPVTRRGLLGWRLARTVARLGGFRLLPAAAPPPDFAGMRSLFPEGILAVQASRGATRRSGLVLDHAGGVLGAVKIADDTEGAERLRREADRIETFGALLEPPLVAPDIIASAPGALCCRSADWRPRARPWELPRTIASALGAFYRNGGGDAHRGPAHGDFAPWNVLALDDQRWLVIDWEDATSDGTPFQDLFHWLVQSNALLGRPTRRTIIRGFRGDGWVGGAFDAYATAAGLDAADRIEVFRTYLQHSSQRLSARGTSHRREIAAREHLLRETGGANPSGPSLEDR